MNLLYVPNNKFLGKCQYGRYPWIGLAVECERMVEKGINFIFYFGTAYDISRMESIGNSWSFSLTGKTCLSKRFISQFFCFELQHLYKSLLPSAKGLSFTLCNFYFLPESPSYLIKHQLRGTMIVLEHWMQLIFECAS